MSHFSWLFYPYLIATLFHATPVLALGPCRRDQDSLLLKLKDSLEFDTSASTKLVYWNNSTDCCSWEGVSCTEGRVTGLDLSAESITGGIDGSSSLFQLQFLQSLNLALNRIKCTTIPPDFGKLTNLIYLNLSGAGFAGQIPASISSLRRLVILDLSTQYFLMADSRLKLESPNLRMFVQNFSKLRELYLDGVGISAQGSQALSSSLSNLRVLSLSNCKISGPIDSSILRLTHLSVLRLDNNNLSGEIPGGIFQLPGLQTLDLSYNELLNGSLPDSIGNFTMLSRIEISNCNLRGQIPSSITRLKELVRLDLSSNKLTGAIPSFGESTKLTEIVLSYNILTGQLPTQWEGLQRLESLDLRYNQLHGNVPSSLFGLPTLRRIQLSNNQLSGELELPDVSSSPLETLDLSSNKLGGLIPMPIFELRSLNFLQLSYNNFSGQLHLGLASQLKNLSSLDLSYNRLSVNATIPESSLPSLTILSLASCKLMVLPEFFRGQSRLVDLDLSNNQIGGQIPSWLLSFESLEYLNLSCNHLVSIQESQPTTSWTLFVIDVHKNHLQGKIPHIPTSVEYLDFSDNNFSSVIPENIGEVLGSNAYYFSVSGNKLTGSIPTSICNATYFRVLDLSNNFLSGTIPPCLVTRLTESESGLGVLNLKRNRLSGTIPDEFPKNCSLQTIHLSGNSLQGKVPNSLANCRNLELLDLGNNHINDTFPCHLKSIVSLRVLVLRSNHFYGTIDCQHANDIWPMLQILDIASNKFIGSLPGHTLRGWQAMKRHENKPASSEVKQLQFEIIDLDQWHFPDAITITSKGAERELVKILTIFTSIDLSCNGFTGPIPEAIGELNALYLLNLSHNALTGSIPPLLGNASQLESLDLSCNELKGEIPETLADLNFLSLLNLSNNNLEGMIPISTQLQSFSEASYEPNQGLCGLPLKRKCTRGTREDHGGSESGSDFEWSFLSMEMGFIFGLMVLVVPLYFCKRWRTWYCDLVDRIAFWFCPGL